MSLIDDIKRDREAGMDPKHGHWIWCGQPDHLSLTTAYGGRRYIMDFVRKGMRGAQPRFQIRGIMHKAVDDLASFSVGDDCVRGHLEAKKDKSVYRYDVSGIDHPDARRIARVPQMEAALLAAEELADHLEAYKTSVIAAADTGSEDDYYFVFEVWDKAEAALAAYRAAIGAA